MTRCSYSVNRLFETHGTKLGLKLFSSENTLSKTLKIPEAHRPGVILSGYLKHHREERVLVLGKLEMGYLRDLEPAIRKERLFTLLTLKTPAVILCKCGVPPKELLAVCEAHQIAVFTTSLSATHVLTRLGSLLIDDFSPEITCHGTLVEAFGVGVLIQGDSSIGKSESALGLIERGHRLICDDVVKIKRLENAYLEGSGPEFARHMMEIRGIGLINVAHLYGAVCVRDKKRLDVVIKLEEWSESSSYDRVGLDEKFCTFLEVDIPFYTLPVKPGRDVVLLIETIVLNHRLKEMGYHSAKEFNLKWLQEIAKKQRVKHATSSSTAPR